MRRLTAMPVTDSNMIQRTGCGQSPDKADAIVTTQTTANAASTASASQDRTTRSRDQTALAGL